MKKWLKKLLKCFDEQDFNNALANLGNAKDREDFEWKLRNRLFRSGGQR